MNDLQTINFVNAYAAEVERLKEGDSAGAELARRTWPSDAPARAKGTLTPETHRLKSWNRRLALLRSAQKRKLDARSRVQAAASRVLGCDSLANRQALVRALAAETEL